MVFEDLAGWFPLGLLLMTSLVLWGGLVSVMTRDREPEKAVEVVTGRFSQYED